MLAIWVLLAVSRHTERLKSDLKHSVWKCTLCCMMAIRTTLTVWTCSVNITRNVLGENFPEDLTLRWVRCWVILLCRRADEKVHWACLGTLTSWNPLAHSRPVTGLLYLLLHT